MHVTGGERARIYHLKNRALNKQEQVAGARKGLASPQKNNGKGFYLMYLASSHLLQLHACRFKLFGLIYS